MTAFTSRGVFALLYARGPLTAEEGSAGSIRWLPQRAVYALREKIAAIWPDGDTAAFVTAELTGDRSGMAEEDAAVMTQAGVAHLFAVSGLHCAFLVSLLGLLLPRPAAGAGGGTLYGGAAVLYGDGGSDTLGGPGLHHADIPAGGSAAAPGERRAYQPVGGAAGDPAGQSLRCSGGEPAAELRCHAGTGVLLPKAERLFKGLYRGKRPVRAVVSFVAANLSASLAAMVFTIPLTACYFNTFFPHSAAE